MNRIAGRSWVVVLISALLLCGFLFFVAEYFMNSSNWVAHTGSPHVYSSNGKTLTSMVIIDKNDNILLDTRGGVSYSDNVDIRTATVHWVGDKGGNINDRTLTRFSKMLAELRLEEYDVLSGMYTYGDYTSVAQLTIDSNVQTIALSALGDYKGTVAVYNYKTGEILCAVSTPAFDPENVPENIDKEYDTAYFNKFIDYPYAPGSIFKIVTAAAALETVENMDSWTFTCNATYEIPGYDVTCEMSHGYQSLKDAFCNSCNCAFAALAQEIGSETLTKYVEKFGVCDSITFDGITTASGNFDKPTTESDLAWSAVGQFTDEIIPAAYLNFVGAIARGGEGVKPHIVRDVSVRDKSIYTASSDLTERIVSEETALKLQEFMRNNVAVKYGDNNFPGLTVCAKTGTAEVDSETGDVAPNAMLTGYVADDAYPLAFIVCVEDAGYGRTVCIPIISKVLAACKSIMDTK